MKIMFSLEKAQHRDSEHGDTDQTVKTDTKSMSADFTVFNLLNPLNISEDC
ncbi:hypothetical protein MNV_1670015 [Candidatus Methanoperedens nitroreducens]|uniref:Uncharacterized protein n=1 Tax=Candidatus Methanoperedens nitratireducens TaxID=1392998 RepID=A0A284VLM5_9EURY|nr:hypothetical protein MNV_1670015 [Candidatus Methanoperedens nitroreducens]